MEPVAHEEADPLADRTVDSAKLPSRDLSRLTAGPRQHHGDDGLPFWGCFGKSVRNEQSRAPSRRANSLAAFRVPGSSIVVSRCDSTPFQRSRRPHDDHHSPDKSAKSLLEPSRAFRILLLRRVQSGGTYTVEDRRDNIDESGGEKMSMRRSSVTGLLEWILGSASAFALLHRVSYL